MAVNHQKKRKEDIFELIKPDMDKAIQDMKEEAMHKVSLMTDEEVCDYVGMSKEFKDWLLK